MMLGSTFKLAIYSTSDGSIISAYQNSFNICNSGYCTLVMKEDGSSIYATSRNGTNFATFCEIKLSFISYNCYTISPLTIPAVVINLFSSNLFFVTNEYLSPYSLVYSKFNYDSASISWINSVACPIVNCGVSYSGAIFINSENLIYSSVAYNSVLMLAAFNQTDGSVYSNRYKSSITCNYASGISKLGNIFYLYALCFSQGTIITYDRSTENFKAYTGEHDKGEYGKGYYGSLITGVQIFSIAIESTINRLIACGVNQSSDWYIFESPVNAIFYHPDVSNSLLSMLIMDSTDYPILSYSPSISGNFQRTWSTYSISYGSVTQSLDSSKQFSSDLSYWLDSVSYLKLKAEQHYELDIQLTCSVSGLTDVNYSIGYYLNSKVPSWAKLNLNKNQLILDTPRLYQDTNFSFAADLAVAGDANLYQKPIFVQVLYCQVQHCITCENAQYDKCKICEEGYSVFSDLHICAISEISGDVKVITSITFSSFITRIVAVVFMSIVSLSSPQGLWIMINQIQLLFILFITGADIPKDVVDFIIGMKFASFSFNFMNYGNIWIFSKLQQYFDCDQSNSYLSKIDLNSCSTVINISALCLTLAYTIFLHLLICILKCAFKKLITKDIKCKKLFNILLETFTFSAYIRLYLESYQFVLFSVASEISEFKHSKANQIILLAFACAIYCICFILTFLCVMQTAKAMNSTRLARMKYFVEFFKDLRNSKYVRLYSLVSQINKEY